MKTRTGTRADLEKGDVERVRTAKGGEGKSGDGYRLEPDRKLDVERVLQDLEHYRPRRWGWHWRERPGSGTAMAPQHLGPFTYFQTGTPLDQSIPLPAAKYFDGLDPQPQEVITTEIASGRFEDDLRRMRMAAWHGADHIMVIRTAGQSHFDGLIEGTPEGVGGVPITRKQVRASRKALDLIEDEVGRPINFHSYISGVAGPEIAVMFAEEGVNGAHQDPQYNVLYRNINMVRSFVDAAEAKKLMTWADMVQIDGAHNANATAREAWKVMPELMVQHAINCAYSEKVGMPAENIALSSVPPTAPPAPNLRMDLPYAVALRQLFGRFRIRAQQNTRYMESDMREATVTHVLNLLVTRLTSADIQSTITPDEGRNVPWHYNNVAAVDTAKQALVGMDGLKEMVKLDLDPDGVMGRTVRELKERAVLFMQEVLDVGGYFAAVEEGFFIDSGMYPERNGDGIVRMLRGGVGQGTVVPRDSDYFAPVCEHFGNSHIPEDLIAGGTEPGAANPNTGSTTSAAGYAAGGAATRTGMGTETGTGTAGKGRVCDLIGGCTLHNPERIAFIDELDEQDNVVNRLAETEERRRTGSASWDGGAGAGGGRLRPEVQWSGDGYVTVTMFIPTLPRVAQFAALEIAKKMGLEDAEVIHTGIMQMAEGSVVEVKGRVTFDVDPEKLVIPEPVATLSEDEIRDDISEHPMKVVAATVGQDEHSVGMREIIDIKHGGLEKFGVECLYLGTSVPVDKVIDAAVETDADAILISTIITHADIHRINMRRLANLCTEKGMRDRFILVAGGTQVTNEMAVECGLDAGFGRGTHGHDVASFLVGRRREKLEGDGTERADGYPGGIARKIAGRTGDVERA